LSNRALRERRGIDPTLAQIGLEWLGDLAHASLATTTYTTGEDRRRMKAMQKQ
jgi:hypothetical protein